MIECKRKLERYIAENGFTWGVWDIIDGYNRYYKKGYYCSFTLNLCIENNLNEVKYLWKYLKKRNRI